MACRTALRSALLIEACRPVHLTRSSASASFRTRGFPSPRLSGQFRTRVSTSPNGRTSTAPTTKTRRLCLRTNKARPKRPF
ncbi:hypothetical protein Prudu_023201 [Prunus dulcis]|uniref:Uncharacterized protein n=1 Tax=Prunus dulcis TaxID=3755 RepID=A0A4Y1S398_PRUDU|nr:hypothetical protein Prudu_023201 [Prunus dulcis]